MSLRTLWCFVAVVALARSSVANDVPLGGFIPFVGIGLTDEFDDFEDPQFSVADASLSVGGTAFGPGSSTHYDIALLDTGAATHILTQEAAGSTGFDLQGEGFRGTEFQPIFGATGGVVNLGITDALGIYAGGLGSRVSTSPSLEMDPSQLRGQTSVAVLEGGADWTLPNILGLPMAAQHAISIRNDEPLIFDFEGRTMRTPEVEFIDIGSGGSQGITRRAELRLEPSGSFVAGPAYFPNPLNIFSGFDNPFSPTVVENGGLFLEIDSEHAGSSVTDVELLFDTGADLTVVSEIMAVKMGFDAVLDEPDFLLEVEGAGGVLGGVPGFYLEEMKIDAVGGSLVLTNVPIAVLNVPDPSSPANVIDGIIGMHVFAGRNLVIDAAPAAGGPGFAPSLYISDPVTENHQWATAAATGDWATGGNWSTAGVPDTLWIAEARNFSGSDQKATISTDSTIFQLAVSGTPTAKMTVEVESGMTLTTFGEALVEDGGELRLAGGKLDSQVVNIEGGTLAGNGEIFAGTGPITGVVRNLGGTIAPDGLLTITGDLSNLKDATIAIDLFAGGNDMIDVSRNAFLDGTLQVSLDPNFSPTLGQQFTLFTFGDFVELDFATLELPLGFDWNLFVDNLADSVVLEATAITAIPGDFDNDLMVDSQDLSLWEGEYNVNFNGLDFLAWQENYGFGSLQAAVSSVPEPGTIGLLLLACWTGTLGRRNWRI